jgi:hypothetical protein
MLVKTKLHQVDNDNFDITRMLDQSNLSVPRCRLIFLVECSVGGYLALAKTIVRHYKNEFTIHIKKSVTNHVTKCYQWS